MSIISLSQLKTHLGISDTTDDTVLTNAVNAANADVVEYCGRRFDKTESGSETTRVYQRWAIDLCVVDDFWTTTNLIVRTDDDDDGQYETTWTINTDFIVEPLNGLLHGQQCPYYLLRAVGRRWFGRSARPTVQVTAAWGWPSIPGPVTQAALIQAARYFKRKDSPEGVLGGFAEFGAVRVASRLDPDVRHLLAPYRRAEVVGLIA